MSKQNTQKYGGRGGQSGEGGGIVPAHIVYQHKTGVRESHTQMPSVEETVEERVARYGMAYKGILPDEAIERSQEHWRNELLDFADALQAERQKREEMVREAWRDGYMAGQAYERYLQALN